MFKPAYLLLAILLLTPTAFALTDTQKQYQKQLASRDLADVKSATQQIVRSHETDTDVLDVLAEVLISHYPQNLSYELDTLAWACRALGDSGNARYAKIMEDIIASNVHRKLKKYATKALRKMEDSQTSTPYTAGTVKLEKLQAAEKASRPVSKFNESEQGILALANYDLHSIKRLAQKMHAQGSPSVALSDSLAQFIANNYKIANNHNSDTLAWACKGLAGNDDGRYNQLLEEVVDNTNSRAMRKHCSKALKRVKGQTSVKPFKNGDVDLGQLAKKIKAKH